MKYTVGHTRCCSVYLNVLKFFTSYTLQMCLLEFGRFSICSELGLKAVTAYRRMDFKTTSQKASTETVQHSLQQKSTTGPSDKFVPSNPSPSKALKVLRSNAIWICIVAKLLESLLETYVSIYTAGYFDTLWHCESRLIIAATREKKPAAYFPDPLFKATGSEFLILDDSVLYSFKM